jgi:hypothetical protein
MAKKATMSMVPNRRDFEDAILQLRYYLGMTQHHPHYDRYDYKQKFEYWGLIFGNIIMVVTGFILYFPVQAANLIPGGHPGGEGGPLERRADGLLRHHHLAHLQRAPEPGRLPLRRDHLHG